MTRHNHHHKGHLRIGRIINDIGKKIVKPVFSEAKHVVNAPLDLAKTAIDKSGSLGLPLLILGGLGVIVLLKMK